ncbi:MAG: hypothetical protein ACUVRD_05955 [Bacteroidia bacterium]
MQRKEFFLYTSTLLLLSGLGSALLPHWSASLYLIAVLTYLLSPPPKAILWAALAHALLWLGLSVIMDFRNTALLSERIAELFRLPRAALFGIVALIGGILGAVGAWVGLILVKILPTLRKKP